MAFQIRAWIPKVAAVLFLAVIVSQAGMALGQEAPAPAPASGGSFGTVMPSIAAGIAATLVALTFSYLM
ncbi:hypothetical protein O6H91_05G055200 [Diphasiastrum complanatum]|uniref:Uncharacterized protein n=1 Tax=Diphasiastrum complanatum TaxID=34168 RepID=A0ACC2DNC1_DIPCM|nr:hypothetical protein O6H91_05G055200 [Diphasiastrum complanatum]